MYLYLLLIPGSIILLSTAFEVRRAQRNDRILFSYCQLRRSILALLSKEGARMNDHDYQIINSISNLNDHIIHDFKNLKNAAFNINNAKKFILQSKKVVDFKSVLFNKTSNPEITKIQDNLKYCIVQSALTYSPFLHSITLIQVLKQISKILIKAKIRRIQNSLLILDTYQRDMQWIRINPIPAGYNLFV